MPVILGNEKQLAQSMFSIYLFFCFPPFIHFKNNLLCLTFVRGVEDRQEEVTIQVIWEDITAQGKTLKFSSTSSVVYLLQKVGARGSSQR